MKFLLDGACSKFSSGALARHFATETSTDAAVRVTNQDALRFGIEISVEDLRFRKRSVQSGNLLRRDFKGHVGFQRERGSFRVIRRARAKAVVVAFKFGERGGAKLGKLSADLVGEGTEIGNDHFRFAVEAHA